MNLANFVLISRMLHLQHFFQKDGFSDIYQIAYIRNSNHIKNSDKINHLIRNLLLVLLCFFFFLYPETIYRLFITTTLQIVVTSEMGFLFSPRSIQNLKLLQLFLQISDLNTSNRHRTISGKKSSHVDESCFKTNTVVWCEVNFFL